MAATWDYYYSLSTHHTHLFIAEASKSLNSGVSDRQWHPDGCSSLLPEVTGQRRDRLLGTGVSEAVNQNGMQLRVVGVGEGGGEGSFVFCECSGLGWNSYRRREAKRWSNSRFSTESLNNQDTTTQCIVSCTLGPLYCGHLGDLVKCPVYSGTPLLWTPWGPGKVSCMERCPHFRSKFLAFLGIAKCP